jgi:hypothetical protein
LNEKREQGEKAMEGQRKRKKERRTCNFWYFVQRGAKWKGLNKGSRFFKFEKIICIRKEKREREKERKRQRCDA